MLPLNAKNPIESGAARAKPEVRRMGAGRLAMNALIQEAERAGFWKLVSRVISENTASLNLLRSVGFREVGRYQKHARLDGVWRDTVIVERLIPANLDRCSPSS